MVGGIGLLRFFDTRHDMFSGFGSLNKEGSMKEIIEAILEFLKVLRGLLALIRDKENTRHSRQ